MSIRRLRSNGMHADTEQEYLNKLIFIEKSRSNTRGCGEYYANENFCFGSIDSPVYTPANFKKQMVLLMSDDLQMTHNRLGQLIAENYKPISNNVVYDMDCFVYQERIDSITYQYTIWIQNTNQVNQWFKTLYYPKFEQFVLISRNGGRSHVVDVIQDLQQLNSNISVIETNGESLLEQLRQ